MVWGKLPGGEMILGVGHWSFTAERESEFKQEAPPMDMFSMRPVPRTTSQVFVSSAEMTKIEFEAKRTQNEKNSLHGKHKTLTAKIPNDLIKSAMRASHMQHCKHLLTGSAKE